MFISLLLIISYYCLCNDNMKFRGMIYTYVLYVEFVLSNMLHELVLHNISSSKYVLHQEKRISM